MGYNGMISSYAWLCGGEFPSQRLRSFTFGLAASVGFFGAWLTTFTAPYFINPDALNWGPKYGYLWAPSCAIGALWTYFYLPEVKNRTFEEIDEMVSLLTLNLGNWFANCVSVHGQAPSSQIPWLPVRWPCCLCCG
jgi:hypothetical protein